MKIYMKDNFCTVYKLAFSRMHLFLAANGHEIVDRAEAADAVIAGVCAAFEADEDRSVQMLADLNRTGQQLYLIGCMVRVSPHRLPAGERFSAWEHRALVERLVPNPRVSWDTVAWPDEFRTRKDYRTYNPQRKFVPLSLGCAFDCSYCPHKMGAGRSESRGIEDILRQLRQILLTDVTSIILTAIDTASYGLEIGCSFGELLEQILALPDSNHMRYHIAQFNPEGIVASEQRETMIRCCSDRRIVDFQMPIQTSADRLLHLMNRHYCADDVSDFIERVRYHNPDLFWRTDLMVGFPTETEAEFAATIDFAARHYHEVCVYGYEPKKGTVIVEKGPPPWSRKVVSDRVTRARTMLEEADRITHSGGQNLESLIVCDHRKEVMRMATT